MKKHIILYCLLFLGIIDFTVYPAGKSELIIFNPGSHSHQKYFKDWHAVLEKQAIYEWGRSKGLYLYEDKLPLINDKAVFISKFGSKITVSNLERDKFYSIWIDFIRFRCSESPCIVSGLQIEVKSKNTDYVYTKKLKYNDIDNENRFKLDIPYKLTLSGEVSIHFREDSPQYGGWGIWDIIISSKSELPDKIELNYTPKKMKIKDRIVD